MRWVAFLVTVLAGCDGVFQIAPVQVTTEDATTTDAPPGPMCPARSPAPFFCADFDDPTPLYYEAGLPVDLAVPATPTGVTVAVRGPAKSAPNALWIESMGSPYTIVDDGPGTSTVHRLDATLAIQFSQFASTYDGTAIIVLGAENAAYNFCYVALQVEPSPGPRLIMESHCGSPDVNKYPDVLTSLPSAQTWVPVTFSVDLTTHVATATVGGTTVPLDLGVDTSAGGRPHVALGVSSANGTSGPTVALDDVVVVTTP